MYRGAKPGDLLHIDHIFSCEIDPMKQALIQRNFPEATIFRDVREMAEDRLCSTVYGAPREVPLDLDILVAGFACVDFSTLNKKRKTIDDEGESENTLTVLSSSGILHSMTDQNYDVGDSPICSAIKDQDRHSRKCSGGPLA